LFGRALKGASLRKWEVQMKQKHSQNKLFWSSLKLWPVKAIEKMCPHILAIISYTKQAYCTFLCSSWKEMHPDQTCTRWYELRHQKWTMPWIKQETHLIHYCTLSLVRLHGPSIWAAGYMSSQAQAAVKLVQEWKFNYKCVTWAGRTKINLLANCF